MRTSSSIVVAALASNINQTLNNLFVSRNAVCGTDTGNRCNDRPNSTCPVWGEYGYMPEPDRHGGECPNHDWSLSPRVCMGNLVQDGGAELPEYRTVRQTISWLIQHQEFQLEFQTWGLPEFVELQRPGRLYACDHDGLEGPAFDWFNNFKLTQVGEEDSGPNKVAMRRARGQEWFGNAERRACYRSNHGADWKLHRKTQWK